MRLQRRARPCMYGARYGIGVPGVVSRVNGPPAVRRDAELEQRVRQRWVAIGLNIVALAVAIVVPLAAVGLYLLATVLGLVLPLLRYRRRRS